MRDFGNENYKTPGMDAVRIVDMQSGVTMLQQEGRSVILMCACKDYDHCHRKIVAEHLRTLDIPVFEL